MNSFYIGKMDSMCWHWYSKFRQLWIGFYALDMAYTAELGLVLVWRFDNMISRLWIKSPLPSRIMILW